MTTATPNSPDASNPNRQVVLKDIHAKWNKFSEQEIAALKGKDDLVTQVMSKYSLEHGMAQRDVDALLKGRTI